jgi:putative phage-type endonuclease
MMSISSGTTITAENHAEWLDVRQSSIGGSEAATAVGINPYETALSLYLRKLGLAPPVVETPAMRRGKRFEPLIAEDYADETGHGFIAEQVFVRSPVLDFMTATLDRVRDDGRLVELKSVGVRSAHLWGESGSDEVPDFYLVQAMHQLSVTGMDLIDVAALIAGEHFRVYPLERDDRIIARIQEREQEFWDRVLRRDPPPVDPARDGAALARLWPRAEGEVELGPVGELLVESWEAHGRAIREHEAARDRAKTELLCHLGEAASARLADGRILTRRVVDVAGQQVTRKPYSYVDLRLRRGS